jgi:type IV secretory pathway TraG/TraD family ATPase VirD4
MTGKDVAVSRPLGTAAWHNSGGPAGVSRGQAELFIGLDDAGGSVTMVDDRHVLVVAGTRSGKGVSVIIPNLCLWPGSAVVIDPKGENAWVTARRRGAGSTYTHGMGQTVHILDPFDVLKVGWEQRNELLAAYNPMSMLDKDSPELVDNAFRLADALIVQENSKEPFWEESARAILKAVLLHVATWPAYVTTRTLMTVRRLLQEGKAEERRIAAMSLGNQAPSALSLLFKEMQRNPACNGLIATAGAQWEHMESASGRTLASILQVVASNTEFLDSPGMQRCLSQTTFRLSDLKTDPKGVSLYLCLPQRFMPTHARWLRLMVSLIVTQMERIAAPPANGAPVLMVLDEFPALRRMRVLEDAAAQMAGFGVKFMFVCQTLAQLKDIYRDNWETLVANSGLKIFFGNDDHFTREYASKLIGDHEVVRTTGSGSESRGTTWSSGTSVTAGDTSGSSSSVTWSADKPMSGTYGTSSSRSLSVANTYSSGGSRGETKGWSQSVHRRAFLSPDEIGRMFGDPVLPRALVLASGHQPLSLRRTFYFCWSPLRGRYDMHPHFRRPPTLKEVAAEEEAARLRAIWDARIKKQGIDSAKRALADLEQQKLQTKLREQEERYRQRQARGWVRNFYSDRFDLEMPWIFGVLLLPVIAVLFLPFMLLCWAAYDVHHIWGWIIYTLFFGSIGFLVYFLFW